MTHAHCSYIYTTLDTQLHIKTVTSKKKNKHIVIVFHHKQSKGAFPLMYSHPVYVVPSLNDGMLSSVSVTER